jgi:hypothetical protein
MNTRNLTAAIFLFAAFASSALAADNKVVVELFTSQGCSSCPPADRVLGELTGEDQVIALSVPVDYWDYLGWRDTLAQPAHSNRQRGYSQARGDREVYTPQVVINGIAQTIGSDKSAIEATVQKIAANNKTSVPIIITKNASNIEVDVGAGTGAPASVWLLIIAKATPVVIGRGENRGKTVTYYNVVRSWQRVGDWNGASFKNSIPMAELNYKDADSIAILVQPGSIEKPGPIRGAAILSLR